ncbi:MAG: CBS domain-containing protein [Candidatus Marsarchaeota archaeon]|nr:CBS domain-containing protein [Candidatus Marsarchaeota archaeon]
MVPTRRSDLIKRFTDLKLPALPVFNKSGQFEGIVTADSLIRDFDQEQVSLLVRPCESSVDINAQPSDVVSKAIKHHYVCVRDESGYAGIIYIRDLLRNLLGRKEYDAVSVAKTVSPRVFAIWSETPASLAARLLWHSGEDYAVIVDRELRVLGGVTFVDFLRLSSEERISEKEQANTGGEQDEWGVEVNGVLYIDRLVLSLPVTPIKKHVIPVKEPVRMSDSVSSAAIKLCMNETDSLPVTDLDGRLVGASRGGDLLRTALGLVS